MILFQEFKKELYDVSLVEGIVRVKRKNMRNNERDVSPEFHHTDGTYSYPELSPIWQELLGKHSSYTTTPSNTSEVIIPTLEGDPWHALLNKKGVEVVDLQSVHLRISDQEVDELLQCIPEEGVSDSPQKAMNVHENQ
jgi:hypothetical protein